MGIVSSHELARTWEGEIGIPEKAVRRWALVLSDNTLDGGANALDEKTVLTSLGLTTYGLAHPTWTHLGLRKVVITERFGDSPYHVEAAAEYSYITDQEALAPTSRRADWVFEAQPGQVPALFYYSGSGNGTKYPLTNSAGDFFEGLTAEESMVRISFSKNFWPFPANLVGLTNFVNDAEYMTCPAGTLKCVGVTSDYTKEFFANATYQYWATQAQIQYRQSGWALQLPDVGWNFIGGGQKRRAMVFDFQNGEWVASANPIGLNGSGGQATGEPAILTRRVNPEASFFSLFGKPPTDTTWPTGAL